MDKTKKITIALSCILLILIIALITVLLVVDWNKSHQETIITYEAEDIVKDYDPGNFKEYTGTVEEELEEEDDQVYESLLENMKFHPNETEISKDLNTQAYKTAYYFYQNADIAVRHSSWLDPLFPLALSVVEWSGSRDIKYVWSAAMPTKFLPEEKLTSEYMKNLSIADLADKDTGDWGTSYWGPLQMSKKYGIAQAVQPEMLHKGEATAISEANLAVVVPNLSKCSQQGDRFNWEDCCNRTAGVFEQFLHYSNNSVYTEYITNRFQFMALGAIAHNSGSACLTGVGTSLKDKYSWWSFDSNEIVFRYASELGSIQVLADLKARAEQSLYEYRQGDELIFRISNRVATDKLLAYYVSQGWVSSEGLITDREQSAEKLGYPIQTLYAYFVLQGLYEGR